jgi:hypothetical protein
MRALMRGTCRPPYLVPKHIIAQKWDVDNTLSDVFPPHVGKPPQAKDGNFTRWNRAAARDKLGAD